MKKLLKSEIYGSVNNAQIYYSRKTWSKVTVTVHKQYMNSSHLLRKTREKKNKNKTQETKRKHHFQLNPNGYIGTKEVKSWESVDLLFRKACVQVKLPRRSGFMPF